MQGLITKVLGGIYTILDLDTKMYLDATPRGKLRFKKVSSNDSFNKSRTFKNKTETKIIKLSPKVGDIVLYNNIDNKYVIEEVLERKNDLVRPLAANIDQVVLIFAAKEPDFDSYLLDQFIVLMESEQVNVKIVITKIDLLSDDELKDMKNTLDYYKSIGYDYFMISNKTNSGIDELKAIFKDKVSILSGQTGAGKSDSINSLIPGFNLKTNEISQALGRGKHTTRVSELFEYNGGFVGDTPGFSKLDFMILDYKDLKYYFREFENNQCKFQDCNHISEPGCFVKEQLAMGDILQSRYDNYLKFYNELKEMKRKY